MHRQERRSEIHTVDVSELVRAAQPSWGRSRHISFEVAADDYQRSRYMRLLIQNPESASHRAPSEVPRVLVQFWDDPATMPADVRECLESWRPLEEQGFERLVFDDEAAAQFIARHLGHRYSAAFGRCRHPAMRCDYFRLCFIARHGGFYVDADELFQGRDWDGLLDDNRLQLQPLCYDRSTDAMVPARVFTQSGADSPNWIFYVNNNPLIAPPAHPIVRLALVRATRILLSRGDGRLDIQSMTGPGNLSACVVRHAVQLSTLGRDRDFAFVPDWDAISVSRWPLSYRSDQRNWRLWSQSQ